RTRSAVLSDAEPWRTKRSRVYRLPVPRPQHAGVLDRIAMARIHASRRGGVRGRRERRADDERLEVFGFEAGLRRRRAAAQQSRHYGPARFRPQRRGLAYLLSDERTFQAYDPNQRISPGRAV